MAVGRRSGATASAYLSNAKTASLTPSSLPQDGDTIVVLLGQLTAQAWSVPVGFEKRGPTFSDGTNSWQIYVKYARAGESAPYTFTCAGNSYGPVIMHTYTGAPEIGAVARVSSDDIGSGTSITWPDLDIPVSGGAALIAVSTLGTATVSTPSGFTSGYTGNRGKSFDLLGPSSGTLTGVSGTASVSETHFPIAVFITPTQQVPVNMTAPSLSGNNWQGQTLVATLGDWLAADTFTVVYQRDGSDI